MSTTATPSKFDNIPANACTLRVGEVEFTANGEGSKSVKVKLTARTGKPIEHWFWGRIVHDLAGMKLAKPRLPIDYCHYDDEVIGYLNKFETGSGDLVTSGALVPYKDGDRANEIIFKHKEGVPYEASINFGGSGIRIQEVMRNEVVEVNGYQFEGPGLIVRQWPLRGVAICPYGADQNTKTELNAGQSFRAELLNPQQEQTQMSTNNSTAEAVKPAVETEQSQQQQQEKPAEAGATAVDAGGAGPTALANASNDVAASATALAQGEAAATPAVDPKAQPFITAFGDKGATWYLSGKPFESAATEFIAGLQEGHKTELAAKQTKIDQLETQLAAYKTATGSEEAPPARSATELAAEADPAKAARAERETKFAPAVGEHLAKHAASIKLPGRSAK